MGFLQPLAILLIPAAAVIVALYLLRFRRPIAPVPSVGLWDELLRDREANALWQRLHVSVLLLLQLLVVLLLIAAVARPWVKSRAARATTIAIVLDTSASMSGRASPGGEETRIERARQAALDVVNGMAGDASATLIIAGASPSVAVSATADKARLRAAISEQAPGVSAGDMVAALRLADAVTEGRANAAIWLLSDGAFQQLAGRVDLSEQELHYVPAAATDEGSFLSNQGITSLRVVEAGSAPGLYLQVASSAPVSVTRRVEVEVDGAHWEARTLDIGPASTQVLELPSLPAHGRVVLAELSGADDLAVDDRAWVVRRGVPPLNLLLVTGGSRFLEVALSILPGVTLYKVAPDRYDPNEIVEGRPFDLTIVDAGVPTNTLEVLPEGGLLVFAPRLELPGLRATGVVTEPLPLAPSDGTEMRQADTAIAERAGLDVASLSTTRIALAARLELSPEYRELLSSDKGPLVAVREHEGRRIGVVAFSLGDTDLPLQPGFPVMMRDLVRLLRPDDALGVPAAVEPGRSVRLPAASERVNEILVEDPAGFEFSFEPDAATGSALFAGTAAPGAYYITQYAGEQVEWQGAFAVNLFSVEETLSPPTEDIGLRGVEDANGSTTGSGTDEVWGFAALAALSVAVIEWLYANRVAIRRAVTSWRASQAARGGG